MYKKKEIITINDILKRKEFFKDKKNETMELEIRSLDANIVIAKPDKELCADCFDMDEKEADRYLVYEVVKEPNIKDKELQEAFGVQVPIDILEEIFEPGEISSIAKEALRFAGYYDSVKVVEDIKN